MMKASASLKKIILLFALFVAGIACAEETQSTKIFLIRHAPAVSDETNDPGLTAEGKALAQRWAAVFASESVSIIYSTDYKRTQQTAQAIADSQGELPITSYDPRDFDLEQLLLEISGKTVVIVGHSNTTPMVANGFLGEERFAQFDHEQYGTLIVVQYIGEGPASAAILHFD
ncbi:MAG: 2,3-bisphosphoglycerate-dependent phosphoglycerate mutase [Candidatus Krumholzibacteriia bacterium]|jgi:2,3-bisphosphoglycerate-dependent phosphoglycerate mutase